MVDNAVLIGATMAQEVPLALVLVLQLVVLALAMLLTENMR